MALLKTFLFTIVVPGTVAGLMPYLLLSQLRILPPLPVGSMRYVGLVPLVLGVLTYLWCALEFALRGHGTPSPTDPPRELVVSGPYRHSRNPMYVAIASILLGVALFFGSTEVLLYATLVTLAFHLRIVGYEEPTLERSFGASFREYRSEVPRWLLRRR